MVFYIAPCLALDLVLDIELIADLGLGSLRIFFIIDY